MTPVAIGERPCRVAPVLAPRRYWLRARAMSLSRRGTRALCPPHRAARSGRRGPGQDCKAARVLVVGAGGLGSPVVLYLAAAGVGTIGIVDYDTVSLSNLQRQIAHRTADVGRPKTESARDAIAGASIPASRSSRIRCGSTRRQCARADRALRHRRRRLGQFRDPLSGQRCLLLCEARLWSPRR